ncbi:hypothetical protein D9758_002063 [Tetrapyrgos nigripes]|uniref:J domain-containing protein n=1 Tax=Tetrapyrgos nigripes TaxID=182062 RepID=A0A8H5GSV9_9AGAR|nr:hypothetical protein D9758_002063 [Tetrapyrgos nigripes]
MIVVLRRRLPSHLRHASTHSPTNPFPFPNQPNPSAHQIFHLPRNANQEQIKQRYYELVRIYHPDKAESAVPSQEAHSRFQSISNAYNVLRGKSSSVTDTTTQRSPDYATTAARRAVHLRRHRELYEAGVVDERWKDRFIIFGIIATIAAFVAQTTMTRHEALEEVLSRSRQLQLERVDAARRRKTVEDPRLAASDNNIQDP